MLRLAIAAAVSTALFSSRVAAHGYLIEPKSTDMNTTFTATIDSAKLPAPYAGKKWNDNPAANARQFATSFAASGAKSIKPMMDEAAPGCGRSSADGTPIDVSSMKSLKWGNDQEKKGFLPSHTGPCETWIDGVMVQQDIECVSKYPGYPANVPIDYSACKSAKCTLTFYWLALHEAKWQVYKHCAPITNGGGGAGAGAGGTGNSTAGGAATSTPTASGSADTGPAPQPSTSAPSVAHGRRPVGTVSPAPAASPQPVTSTPQPSTPQPSTPQPVAVKTPQPSTAQPVVAPSPQLGVGAAIPQPSTGGNGGAVAIPKPCAGGDAGGNSGNNGGKANPNNAGKYVDNNSNVGNSNNNNNNNNIRPSGGVNGYVGNGGIHGFNVGPQAGNGGNSGNDPEPCDHGNGRNGDNNGQRDMGNLVTFSALTSGGGNGGEHTNSGAKGW
jgi:hypothetical protein